MNELTVTLNKSAVNAVENAAHISVPQSEKIALRGMVKELPYTEVPTTFTTRLDNSINYVNPKTKTNVLWTNANATEHMGEYISRFGKTSDSIGIRSQVMLESYSAALNVAMNSLAEKSPGRYFGMYGNWELGINTETGIVYHARMIY